MSYTPKILTSYHSGSPIILDPGYPRETCLVLPGSSTQRSTTRQPSISWEHQTQMGVYMQGMISSAIFFFSSHVSFFFFFFFSKVAYGCLQIDDQTEAVFKELQSFRKTRGFKLQVHTSPHSSTPTGIYRERL